MRSASLVLKEVKVVRRLETRAKAIALMEEKKKKKKVCYLYTRIVITITYCIKKRSDHLGKI